MMAPGSILGSSRRGQQWAEMVLRGSGMAYLFFFYRLRE